MKQLQRIPILICLLLTLGLSMQAQVVLSGLDNGTIGTLRSQVDLAVSGDVIVIAENVLALEVNAEIEINKDLTIQAFPGLGTTIDADSMSRIFNVVSGTLTLNNLTLTNGAAVDGGAIFNSDSLILNNCVISNSVANGVSGSGGAIFNDTTGVAIITDTEITACTAIRAGGGIEHQNNGNGVSLVLDNVRLAANIAGPDSTAAPGNGGGLHITGGSNSTINACIVSDNSAALEGGGLWNGSGTMTVLNTMISGNIATGDAANEGGGGIFNAGGTVAIDSSAITLNSATGVSASGGGILNDQGVLTCTNTIIDGNVSIRAGGGIEDNSLQGNLLTLVGVTLSNNITGPDSTAAPGNGGGLHISGAGDALIDSCLVSGNAAALEGGGLWNGAGLMTIVKSNITGNTALGDGSNEGGGGVFNAGGTVSIDGSSITLNTAIGAAASGGGILNDLGTLSCTNTIIDGNISIRAGGGIEDNSLEGGTLTLVGVTLSNNSTGIDTIAAPGNGGGLHITGPGASLIDSCLVISNTAALEGGGLWNGSGIMTVINSTINTNVASGDAANEGGGGIFNAGGTLNVEGSIVNENSVTGSSASGGGILNDLGTLTVINSEITGNASIRAGGGIEDNSVEGNLLTLTNVIINNNTTAAAPGNGGGLHITGLGDAMIENCTVVGNFASLEGGGLWNGSGSMTVIGATISANVANGDMANEGGGGIFNAGGILSVEGSIITENMVTGSSASGGGILNDLGVLTVIDTEITGNASIRAGGGIEDNSVEGNLLVMTNVILNNNTTASAPGNGGGLHITGLGDAMIENCTVTGNSASLEGGGLWNGAGTMTVLNTNISANTALGDAANEGGGGIFNAGGILSVEGSVITENSVTGSSASGGGILNDMGVLTVVDTEISTNTSIRAGGGIEDNSAEGNLLTLINVTLDNNTTASAPGNGGGLHITGPGDSMIDSCTVVGNTASLEGGGLWNGSGTMSVVGTTVSANVASGDGANEGGGGIFNSGGILSVEGSIITENSVTGSSASGGGILNDMGTLTVSNTEITGNASIRAGGGIEDNSAGGNLLTLTNVTLTNNTTALAPGNGGGLHITGSGNSVIDGCVVTGNTASLEGGGLWNGSGTMSVVGTTISANVASGDAANEGGGGIFNAGGTLNIETSLITDNSVNGASASGGGILNDMGVLTVIDTEIAGNSSVRAGGGIEDNSVEGNLLTLTNVTLNSNTTASAPGNGGGLHITGSGDSMIDLCTVSGNTAGSEGGGLWNGSGLMIVTASTIDSNTSLGDGNDNGGAGVFNAGGTIEISGSTISNNTDNGAEGAGAGIHNDASGEIMVMLSTISGNSSNQGGGIHNNGSSLSINASTIAFNSASVSGGGISSMSTTTVKNTIVASNSSSSGIDLSGSFTSENYNLIGADDENVFDQESDDQEGVDPLLAPLAANAGGTATHQLQAGSSAYNAGDPDDMFADQNGQAVFDGRRDIGADEAQTDLVSTQDISAEESGIDIYPNPAINDMTIDIPTEFGENISYMIYETSTSRLVNRANIESGRSIIDVSELVSGSYYLRIQSDDYITTRSFIKIQ